MTTPRGLAALPPLLALLLASLPAPARAAVPPNAVLLGGTEVDENLPVGSPVGVLTALDADPDDTHTFLLVDNPGNAFRVGADGVTLETAKVLDYEVRSSYGIRVRATDSFGLFLEQSFYLSVRDVNDPPLGVFLSPTGIAEDRPLHSVVGTLSAIADQDQNERHTFTLLDDAGGAFAIEGALLTSAAPLDHEAADTLEVLVRVSDRGGLVAEDWITVYIFDRNEPPTGVALDLAPLPESAPPGSLVATLAPLGDPDAVDAHTFSLVDLGAAPFVIIGTALRTTGPLDFESHPTWTLTVRVTDIGGLYADQAALVVVTDVNEAPSGVAVAPSSVHESAAIGTFVGALSALDPDAGDTHQYAIIGPGARFAIVGGFVVTAAALDHEADPVAYLPVRVTDRAGLSADALVPITVLDDNEAPTDVTLGGAAVFEDANIGATIGAFAAVDPDRGDTHRFTLVSDPTGTFAVQDASLRLARKVDFELAASYPLRVRATDSGGLWVERDVTVSVRDVAEPPTGVTLDATEVAENRPAGTLVGHLAAAGDPDAGDSHSFTLLQNPGGAFRIAADRLETAAPLDAEAGDRRYIRVRVVDSAGLSAEASFEITVTDLAEPPTGVTLSGSGVAEGRPAGEWIGQLAAVGDPDPNESFTFALVANPDGAVALAGNTVTSARSFDFESEASVSFTVRATDKSGLSVDQLFTLAVLDRNEAPTSLSLSNAAIAEGLPAGTVVGVLTALGDPDANDTHTFTLWDSAGGRFSVDGADLVTDAVLDFERDPSTFRLQVEARDRGGLSVQRTLNVNLVDINEPPTGLTLTPLAVPEGIAPGGLVGQLAVVGDPDLSDHWVFAFVGELDPAFVIAGDRLLARATLDHEARAEHHLQIAVTDSAGHAASASFVLTVGDLPEPPLGVALSPDHLAENLRPGAVVGQLTAFGDPDAGDAQTLAIVDDPDAIFAIDPRGRLIVGRSLDFEVADHHEVTVRATDTTGLYVETALTVWVDDVDDAPVLVPVDVALTAVDEDGADPLGDAVADIVAGLEVSDQDPGETSGILVIYADATHGRWEWDGGEGTWAELGEAPRVLAATLGSRVRFVPEPDFAGALAPALVLRAWDGVGHVGGEVVPALAIPGDPSFSVDTATAGLTVIAHNDAPVVTASEVVVAAAEHAPVKLSSAGPLTVADVDATTLDVEVSAPDGGVRLPAASGVTLVGGTPGGPLLAFSGAVAAVNEALAGMTFTARTGFVGAAEVTVTARDRGQTGLGGPQSGFATVVVEVAAAPDLELQRGQAVVQGGGVDALGTVGAGAALQLAYVVKNRGTLALNFGDDPPFARTSSVNAVARVTVVPPGILPAGAGALLVVTLTPVAPGDFQASLIAATDDPDEGPFSFTIRGDAVAAPSLGFQLDDVDLPEGVPVDLGALPVGEVTAIPVRVVNAGSVLLHVGASQLASREACEVHVEDPFPDIAPGASELMRLYIQPSATGAFEARLVVASDDPAGPRLLWLRGRGAAAGASGLTVQRIPGVPLSDGEQDDLGEILIVGEGSYRWSVRNVGRRAATLNAIEVVAADGVEVEAHVVDGALPVGATGSVLARLVPTTSGPFSVTLRLESAAAVGGSFTWELVGDAVAAARPLPRWWRWDEGLRGEEDDIGAVAVGSPRRLVYLLENGGTAAYWLDGAVFARELANVDVRLVRQPAPVLGPAGDAAYVVVELDPLGPGPLSATLVARGLHQGEVVERTLTLRSAGQAPAVRLRDGDRILAYGDSVSLPLSAPGKRVAVTLTVSSAGTAPLTFNAPPRLIGGEACLGVDAPAFEELGPGDETALVAHLAVASGPFTCRLEVYTTAPEHDGAFVVELRGYGRGAASGGGCAGGGGAVPLGAALLALALFVLRCRKRARPSA
ncbi:MAG: hypothetical protein CVU56_13990 [Deltaproteobacteria bacterium HGW-Deltaproteobacteria-14]|nr:MAG: hypothetical protein CVU56_13990 [Deltaproteobacteria bacterium HGW-Deltaproteobacteria-14]